MTDQTFICVAEHDLAEHHILESSCLTVPLLVLLAVHQGRPWLIVLQLKRDESYVYPRGGECRIARVRTPFLTYTA